MAEQEVIKHTKKVFTIWGEKKKFWHKVGEFLLEIAIIVFAISLSIYLHDQSVKKHERHDAKEFLLGLRQDLRTDIAEMKEDIASFTNSGIAFNYVTSRKLNQRLDRDTITKYGNWFFNTTGLVPNSGRFEGFKSSGKLGMLSDKELQNDILDLYQEDIPNVITSTDLYTQQKQQFFEYVSENRKRTTDSTTNLVEVLATDRSFNYALGLRVVEQIIDRYNQCVNKMEKIIGEINKEYGE